MTGTILSPPGTASAPPGRKILLQVDDDQGVLS